MVLNKLAKISMLFDRGNNLMLYDRVITMSLANWFQPPYIVGEIMSKIFLWFAIVLFSTLCFWPQPAAAKLAKLDAELQCFSGGRQIAKKNVIKGPFADEYKFGHEVRVIDDEGEHNFNFTGGLCIIDLGSVTVRKQFPLSDRLSCYSGKYKIVNFEIYGRETTIDEYLEGRTFIGMANGNYFNSEELHQYLIFGGAACIGEETT